MNTNTYFSTVIRKKDKGKLSYLIKLEDKLAELNIKLYWNPSYFNNFVFFTDKSFIKLLNITDYFQYNIEELEIVETQFVNGKLVN